MNDLKAQLAPGWSAANIAICVVLFFVAWPLSLAMLAYIVWGERFGLDLSKPRTIGLFASRVGEAFKAAIESFSNSQPPKT